MRFSQFDRIILKCCKTVMAVAVAVAVVAASIAAAMVAIFHEFNVPAVRAIGVLRVSLPRLSRNH